MSVREKREKILHRAMGGPLGGGVSFMSRRRDHDGSRPCCAADSLHLLLPLGVMKQSPN